MLIRKIFFSPLYDIADDAYVLDLRRPGISMIVRKFQESLAEKQKQMHEVEKPKDNVSTHNENGVERLPA